MAKYRRFINCNKCAFDNKEMPIFDEYDPYIHFSDPKVKKIAEETYGDESGKVKAKVWHNINGFTDKFKSSDIEYFPELATMGINYPNADLGSKFTKCENLKYIIINRKLGNYTFVDGCPNLEYVILENTNKTNLVSIDYSSFNGCSKLKHIKLPDTITRIINGGAFSHTGVVSINKKDDRNTFDLNNVTSLGSSSFSYCNKLEYADISKIEELYDDIFKSDPLLKTVILNPNLTKLGNNVFNGCKLLEMDNLPEGITSLGSSCFQGCTNLALTELPEGITSLGNSCFYNCTNLALTELPEGITSLGNDCFHNCTLPITHINLPNIITINRLTDEHKNVLFPELIDASFDNLETFNDYSIYKYGAGLFGNNGYYKTECPNLVSVKCPKLTQICSSFCGYCTNLCRYNSDIDGVADISIVTTMGKDNHSLMNGFSFCNTKVTKFILPNIPPDIYGGNNNFPSGSKFYVSSEEVKQAYLNDEKWSLFDPDRFVIGTMETIRQEMETL